MFSRILIANRGEIACRVAATARRLGVETVAVYSDADARAAHVSACDRAVRLGTAAAGDSYLCGDRIIEAALASRVQAIHPGYGFLSENEAFARAVRAAGLIFIGPPPGAIAAMGSKSAAKALMERAGVPLVPGYHGSEQDPAYLRGQADAIGYPVLIKASAGGGGKGMRIVEQPDDFAAALASCKRESAAAFGSDQVLIERYLQRPRHIEIQIFADRHGACVHLFERDCSVQRRHQKVIEEAPAPGLSAAQREQMGRAAVAAARAVHYEGAGTVEFIAEQDGRFYFMEMNTRLQVEHPVTEMITGLDLVEWQFRVACGEALPLEQSEIAFRGHSIEARVYAENPERGFLPSIGRLQALRLPSAVHFERQGAGGEPGPAAVRIDSGVREGDTITPHYDPMIAKLIVWGVDREQAIARMAGALAQVHAVGPATNVGFLGRLMRSERFRSGALETGLIEREQAVLLAPAEAPQLRDWAIAAGAFLAIEAARRGASTDPWAVGDAWRLFGAGTRVLRLACGEANAELRVDYARGASGYTLHLAQASTCLSALHWDSASGVLEGLVGTEAFRLGVVMAPAAVHLFEAGVQRTFQRRAAWADGQQADHDAGGLAAPMPGKVIALLVEPGAQVEAGQPLVVLEAMKMEHVITAPHAGRVSAIHHAVGEQVAEGSALVVLVAADSRDSVVGAAP